MSTAQAKGRDTARMPNTAGSRVTIHMATSLDGFIARKDGSTDWLETQDEFAGGENLDPAFVEAYRDGTVGLCYEVRRQ